MAKIYTRTGDQGTTSLFTGERVGKDHDLIEAIGAVDECNSAIGMAISLLPNSPSSYRIAEQLKDVQHALFDVGAAIATPRTRASDAKKEKTYFDENATQALERWIDQMEASLPKLSYFILPGGHSAGSMLHLARSICRRAERRITPLSAEQEVDRNVFVYLNRLSDYLFVLSRYVNHELNQPETAWQPHKAQLEK